MIAERTVHPTTRKEHLTAAFTITHDDRLALQDALYQEGLNTYQAALAAEAGRLGLSTSGITLTNQEELTWLTQRAEMAANSVVSTYNARLAKVVDQLIAADPKANRDRLASKLGKWFDQRTEAQSEFVALVETNEVAQRATGQFYERNNIEGECWFDCTEVCEECQNVAASNPHTVAEMIEIGVPHIQCPVVWTVDAGDVPSSDQAWLGQ